MPEFFKETAAGTKNFEVRENDRIFQKGDFVALNEYDGEVYTGQCTLHRIEYILDDPRYCKEGFVTLAIKPCAIVCKDDWLNVSRREVEPTTEAPIYGRKAEK